MTPEREKDIRERTVEDSTPCYECGSLYDNCEVQDLLAKIDRLREKINLLRNQNEVYLRAINIFIQSGQIDKNNVQILKTNETIKGKGTLDS